MIVSSKHVADIREQAIGIFDSGLGGLSAVKELVKILPHENIVYFGDTGRVPYGNRGKDTIEKYAKQDIKFLLSKRVKVIVVACGTVSSVMSDIDIDLSVPFIGVLKPSSIVAVRDTRSKSIGVIGTSATISSNAYKREINKIAPDVKVVQKDCPLFVPLVENGFIDVDNKITRLTVQHYLKDIKNQDIDTLILGCTHYPIISKVISEVMGRSVKLVDSGREVALYLSELLRSLDMLNDSDKSGKYDFYVSDTAPNFRNIAKIFLGNNINYNLRKIDIEEF